MVITPKLQARVLEATRRKPKDGSTHWSVRKLAGELNLSKDTVHGIWRAAGIKPHRLERYMPVMIRILKPRPPTSLDSI
jgi:hypothetical protein